MGGAKKSQSVTSNKLVGIAVQSSVAGQVIPRGWGTFRVAANLLWYGDFVAIPSSTSTGGGKGGSPKSSNTTYTYTASVLMGICQGPISAITAVYRDQSNFIDGSGTGTALQQAELSMATGALGQAPWGYLTANHPDQALGYSGIAYAYATNYSLSSSGTLGNHSFEVVSGTLYGSGPDALAADIISDFLPSIPFWATGLIGDLSVYTTYCVALGLHLSPVLDTQRTGGDFLGEILQATNSDCVWSEGLLKFFPYGDTTVGDYVPDLTPKFDLTDDDFIPNTPTAEPVTTDNTRGADAYNYVQVEFLDRTAFHAPQIAIGFDAANIDQYGRLQNSSPYPIHSICNAATAGLVAQLIVQRACNIRTVYNFSLSGNYDMLEAGIDLVTLTSGDLNRVLVRITSIKENAQDGRLDFTAEEMLVGTAHAATYTPGGGNGYVVNRNIDPGPTDELALINPNRTLTNGDYELWIAAAGTSAAWGGAEVWLSWDGTNYGKVGVVDQPGRIGITSNSLPVSVDPDTIDILSVDLSASGGVMLPGTQADADTAVTLCLIDEELISYRDATLTGAGTYNLGYLRRGWFDSGVAAHTNGAPFIRLDNAVAKISYDPAKVGQTVHIKLRSLNTFGTNLQDLSAAVDHVVQLLPGAAPVIDITSTNSNALGGVPASQVLNDLVDAKNSIADLQTQAELLEEDIDAQALALLSQVANAIDLKKYFDGITWVGQTDVKTAVINTTTIAEGSVTTLNLIGAKDDAGTAFVLNGSTVQVSPGVTFASYTSGVTSSLGSNAAAIATESTTRATADTALSTSISTLTSTVTTNNTTVTAAISSEATTRATADTATASLISLIGASAGGGTAFLLNTSTVQVSPGVTFATYTSGVSSSLSGNSAAISSEASTRATADSSLSSSITSLTSTVSGHTANISSLFSTTSGLSAQWVLSINVNGYISGISLASGSSSSSFVIVATDLIFSDPGGAIQTPFYISGGVVHADTMIVGMLYANTIVTSHIQGGQVTQFGIANFGGFAGRGTPSTFFLVASVGITLTDTANCVVQANWSQGQDGTHLIFGYQLVLDGTVLVNVSGNLAQLTVMVSQTATLGAGSHTADLYYMGATQTNVVAGQLSLVGGMR